MTVEITFMWIAVTCYAAATVLFILGATLSNSAVTRWGVIVAAMGLVPQTIALGVRWARLGHGPYIGYYEVANALTLCTVVLFVVLSWRVKRFSAIGIAVMPVALLLLGGSMLASKADLPITPGLASYWLFVHVTFANLAFAALAVSFGMGLVWVIRAHAKEGTWEIMRQLPSQEAVENLMVRFALAGFLLWGMMIVSGAIWANQSWGRYWSWDPIETWSLIVWIIYAVFLHLRFTMRWKGERLAWFAIIAMPVALFCLVGIPTVVHTIHAGYIGGVEP